MEADLQRHYHLNFEDHYRRDEHGRPLLSLRRLAVLIWRFPPVDGAVVALTYGKTPWSRTEHLLDDVRRSVLAIGGVKEPKQHPDRVVPLEPATQSPERRRRLAAARERARERQRRIDAGEIT